MLPAKSDVMQINLMDCKRGNLAEVQNAVSRGADINFQDQYGNTPLISATERDKIEIICYLLSCPEIEIDKTDLYGSTPLSFAVKNSSNAAVRKMVSGGANVNAIDKDGLASLHYAILGWNDGEDAAIKNNKLDVLNFLLECRDIIVDLRTPDDDTSLILAAKTHCLEGAKMLLSHGAAIDSKNKEGRDVKSFLADKDFLTLLHPPKILHGSTVFASALDGKARAK